jgi:hypothetical protein
MALIPSVGRSSYRARPPSGEGTPATGRPPKNQPPRTRASLIPSGGTRPRSAQQVREQDLAALAAIFVHVTHDARHERGAVDRIERPRIGLLVVFHVPVRDVCPADTPQAFLPKVEPGQTKPARLPLVVKDEPSPLRAPGKGTGQAQRRGMRRRAREGVFPRSERTICVLRRWRHPPSGRPPRRRVTQREQAVTRQAPRQALTPAGVVGMDAEHARAIPRLTTDQKTGSVRPVPVIVQTAVAYRSCVSAR